MKNRIRDLIRSIAEGKLKGEFHSMHSSDNYDEKYIKIKFNLDNDLSLKKKILELYNMIIIVRSVFQGNNKYYRQVFLDEFVYK